MESDKTCNQCVPVAFSVSIKNAVDPRPVKTYTITAPGGQTILQALRAFQKTNTDFNFETQSVPTSGLYVVAVEGIKNGPDKFWETLLYNPTTRGVEPISLSYQFRSGDNVFLRFAPF